MSDPGTRIRLLCRHDCEALECGSKLPHSKGSHRRAGWTQQQARKPSEGPVTAGYPAALQRAGEISGLGVLTVAGAGLISQTAQNEGSSGDIDENKEGQASGIRFQLSGAAGNVSTVAGRRFAQRAIDHSRRFRALLTASWVAESSLTPR